MEVSYDGGASWKAWELGDQAQSTTGAIQMYRRGLVRPVPLTGTATFEIDSPAAGEAHSPILRGAGAPAMNAPIGTLYLRNDGGATTTLYVKTAAGAGSGNWTAK